MVPRATAVRVRQTVRRVHGVAESSLLAPHLPQQVEVVLPLFFQSPYPGAPDFDREFRKLIDIPAGFQRLAVR